MQITDYLIFATGAEIAVYFYYAAVVASTAYSAFASIEAGKEQNRQLQFQAQQAEAQAEQERTAARVAQTNAAQATQDAEKNWAAELRQKDRALGTMRANAVKSGLTLDTESDLEYDVMREYEDSANANYMSALNVGGNFRFEASARKQSANNLLLTADEARRAGRAAITNGRNGAVGSILSGVASAAGGAATFGRSPVKTSVVSTTPINRQAMSVFNTQLVTTNTGLFSRN